MCTMGWQKYIVSCLIYYNFIFQVVAAEKLGFINTWPEKTVYQKNNPSPKNNLLCETNKKANFTWFDCNSQKADPLSPENYYTCSKWFNVKERFCKPIDHKHPFYEFHEQLHSSKRQYLHLKSDIGVTPRRDACIFCVATSGVEYIKMSTRYSFEDCCNTPSKKSIGIYDGLCHDKNDRNCGYSEEQFQRKCFKQSTEIEHHEQKLNSNGLLDIIIWWKQSLNAEIYGVKIVLSRAGHYESNERCIVTIYDGKKIFCDDNAMCHYSLAKLDYIYPGGKNYTLQVSSLPYSEMKETTIVTKNLDELCEDYEKENPSVLDNCLIVRDLKISRCFPDRSVTITWNIPPNVKERVQNNTTIKYHYTSEYIEYTETLDIDERKYTFQNVSVDIAFKIYLTSIDGKIEFTYERIKACPYIPPMTIEESKGHEKSKQIVIIPVVVIVLVVSILLFSLFIVFAMRKVKLDISRFNRLISTDTNDNSGGELVTMMEQQSSQSNKCAMIVYPHGCNEVERLVIWLAAHLQSIGIKPLVDTLQTELVNRDGFHNVLLENFEKADNIIALFTEERRNYDLPCHMPFHFIMDQLITQDYVYKNRHRCLAVSFQRKSAFKIIPAYLLGRLFVLPSDFEKLLLSLLGIGLYARSVFERILRMHIANAEEKKLELKLFVQRLNASEHPDCYSDTCKKGIQNDDDEVISNHPSCEHLHEDNIKHDDDDEERLFHSMSSSSESEDEKVNYDDNIMVVDL